MRQRSSRGAVAEVGATRKSGAPRRAPKVKNDNEPPRPPVVRVHLDPDAIIADSFAGGGGASTGIEWALGRSPDIAINHNAEAIAMHAVNHPETTHYIEDVWQVDPREACGGRSVALAWFSPTCTYFSKAKGSPLGDDAIRIRGLCWIAIRWAHRVCPRVIALENVEEFQKYGPLHRTHSGKCRGTHGKGCPVPKGETTKQRAARLKRDGKCHYNTPIKEREGELFRRFVQSLRDLGYTVEWRLLRACDYGAPTTRRRLFLIARCDGHPIVWPTPTHGPGLKPYEPAAKCIDWSIAAPSIFDRSKPLADSTLARIARGIKKYVMENPQPFIAPVCHSGDERVHDLGDPLPTICGNRGNHAIIVPYLVHRSNGERPPLPRADGTVAPGQEPRTYDIEKPLGTIVAQGLKHALTVALLVKHHGGHESSTGGQTLTRPIDTIACKDQKALTVAHLVKFQGTSDAHITASASGLDQPVPTITSKGRKAALVSAFLVRYNKQSGPQPVDEPIGTLMANDTYGLVTVTIDGEEYYIADIGMRMLTPRELYRAQGFSDDFEIAPTFNGKPLTKTAQIRMVGNSVSPPVAKAIVEAQFALAA